MYEITMDELKQLLQNGSVAKKYALDHKEEVISREHSFTLYGPYVPGLGASIPCNKVTPKRARKLLHKTRRKDYIIYHLDENYQILRTLLVLGNKKRNIFHHFEIDGTVYAYAFDNPALADDVHFFRYEDGKPISYGTIMCNHFVFVQFYEYLAPPKMLVSTYRYTPGLKVTVNGNHPDPEAPLGTPDSLVQRYSYEETAEDTDFSHWFT